MGRKTLVRDCTYTNIHFLKVAAIKETLFYKGKIIPRLSQRKTTRDKFAKVSATIEVDTVFVHKDTHDY